MVDMPHFPIIPVWEGCDPGIGAAIHKLQEEWRPYSMASRSKRIDRLIQQVIDPAVAAYAATLPPDLLHFLHGAGSGLSFSDIRRLVGLNDAARFQRQLLRQFVSNHGVKTDQGRRFVATLETLLALTRACARKPPLTPRANGKQVRRDRIQDFCRYCGSPTELAAYANGLLKSDPDGTLQFSSQYCSLHRPKLPDGGWNPEHQRARRSAAQFDPGWSVSPVRQVTGANRAPGQATGLSTATFTLRAQASPPVWRYVRTARSRQADDRRPVDRPQEANRHAAAVRHEPIRCRQRPWHSAASRLQGQRQYPQRVLAATQPSRIQHRVPAVRRGAKTRSAALSAATVTALVPSSTGRSCPPSPATSAAAVPGTRPCCRWP